MNKIKRTVRQIRWFIKDIPYYYNIFKRNAMSKIRYGYGWCASKFINPNRVVDIIHIPKWKLKLFKCVTPDDVYLITGIYHALLRPQICEGYKNFGITDKTYKDIVDILIENYRWNNQTWYDNRADSKIAFTWMNYSPRFYQLHTV